MARRASGLSSAVLCSAVAFVIFGCGSLPSALGGHRHPVPTFLHRTDGQGRTIHVDSEHFHGIRRHKFTGKQVSKLGVLSVDSSFIRDGSDVVVSWRGVQDPSADDWIAMYNPVDTTDDDVLDYFHVNTSSTWREGAGQIRIKLFNMRQPYQFRYYQTVSGFHVEATGRARVDVDKTEPCHGHLALTNRLDEMSLMWTSSCDDKPYVRYAETGKLKEAGGDNNLPIYRDGIILETRSYSVKEMCGAPANRTAATLFRDPGCFHLALMPELKPDTYYTYEYGSTVTSNYKVGTFRSARPLNDPARRTRFIVYGDMGVQYRPYFFPRPGAAMITDAVVEDIERSRTEGWEYDMVAHIGDLSYAVGHGYIWDQWGWLLGRMAQNLPYMVSVGNHEYDHYAPSPVGSKDVSGATGAGFHPSWGNYHNDSYGECGVPTVRRFTMPQSEEFPGNGVFWYTFDLPLIRFIVVSMEHSLEPGSEQYRWLERIAAATDRNAFPWLILMGHRPSYSEVSNQPGDNGVSVALREQLDDLLIKYKVNLMITGHMHSYQRSCPGYKGKCQPDGTATVHVVVGTSGAALDLTGKFTADFVVKSAIAFGYCRVDANATHLHMDWITMDLDKQVKEIGDSVDIPLWGS